MTRVERYTQFMINLRDRREGKKKTGEIWDENNPQGAEISIYVDGTLANGQHRLMAIVASGVSVWMTLNTDVDPTSGASFDVGGIRSPGDYLTSTYRTLAGNKVAAIGRVIFAIEEGQYNKEPSRETLGNLCFKNSGAIDWAREGLRRTPSPIVGAFAWAYGVGNHREELSSIAAQVRDGVACSKSSALIRELAGRKENNTRIERWLSTLRTIRLIEAHILRESLLRMPHFKVEDETVIVKRVRKLLKAAA